MMANSAIKERTASQQPPEGFHLPSSLGLFTFYKQEDPDSPFSRPTLTPLTCNPPSPLPTPGSRKNSITPLLFRSRSNRHGDRHTKSIQNQKGVLSDGIIKVGLQPGGKEKQSCEQDPTPRGGSGNVVDMSFSLYASRKNGRKIPLRVSTEPK
jgi:hypothetical protein